MRKEEAKRISAIITGLGLAENSVCLNIGSSTQHFREVMQSYISKDLIRPIEERGIRVIHCDMKQNEGVDLVGDVLDPEFQQRMETARADVLLCCNILEHLSDPRSFADACNNMVRCGGYIIVTVPMSYPYHPDPIDTMLRPTPDELAAFFPECRVLVAEVLSSDTFLSETFAKKDGVGILLRHCLKVMLPFYRANHWRANASRLLWSFRRYRSSLVVFQKDRRIKDGMAQGTGQVLKEK